MSKTNYYMKSCKMLLLPLLAFSIAIAACGGKDKDPAPSRNAKKVYFKVTGSAGVSIFSAVYGYDATLTTRTSIGGNSWTSPEITVPASAIGSSCYANGSGPDAQATLKVEMFVDGELKKTGTSQGTALTAGAQMNF